MHDEIDLRKLVKQAKILTRECFRESTAEAILSASWEELGMKRSGFPGTGKTIEIWEEHQKSFSRRQKKDITIGRVVTSVGKYKLKESWLWQYSSRKGVRPMLRRFRITRDTVVETALRRIYVHAYLTEIVEINVLNEKAVAEHDVNFSRQDRVSEGEMYVTFKYENDMISKDIIMLLQTTWANALKLCLLLRSFCRIEIDLLDLTAPAGF